jgi:TPR repeat protein
MYQSGDGVSRNYRKAVKCFLEAAELGDALGQYNLEAAIQGHDKAQYSLGVLCEKGMGIPQDHKEAAKWKLKAAEQGEPRAQNHYGVKYARGEGVPRDYPLAYMWLLLAASQGNRPALKNIDSLAEKMSPEDIAKAKQMAREWKPKG